MSSDNSVCIIILGLEVKILVKDLDQAGSYGLCFPIKEEIWLSEVLKDYQVLPILCHEIGHFLFNRTREGDSANMSSEDFSTLSEHWAGIIPQLNLLHFEFRDDGTLESVVQLHEVEDLEN